MAKFKFDGSVEVVATSLIGTLVSIITYGVLLNFSLWSVFDVAFTWLSFLGYGIFAHFILIEAPEAISKVFKSN